MSPERTACVELPVRAPFDGAGLIAFFAARALPGVENAGEGFYERAFAERGRAGTVRVELRRRGRSLFLSQKIPLWANPDALSARVSVADVKGGA